ncbi:MAG TPA: hypothetical protein VJL85_03970 [Gaiellaceae bacterium]|nr:hypothetical protein [Gaiellaceae bacterium]
MPRAGSELVREALGVRPPRDVEQRQGELAKRPDLLRLEVAVDEHHPLERRADIGHERAQRLFADRDPAGEVAAVTGDAVRDLREDEHVDLAAQALGRATADPD